MSTNKPFISLENITIRLGNTFWFKQTSWTVYKEEQWVILGPNGAGKSTLVKALWGGVPLRDGHIKFHFGPEEFQTNPTYHKKDIGYVSFELHEHLMEYENTQQEHREFSGRQEEITTVESILLSSMIQSNVSRHSGKRQRVQNPLQVDPGHARMTKIIKKLGIGHLLQRDITTISTGEMRKTLIARALMKQPKLLILDEPFDSLDETSKHSFMMTIRQLIKKLQVILITHRVEEIPPETTHVIFVKNGEIMSKGAKHSVLTSDNISMLYDHRLKLDEKQGVFTLTDKTPTLSEKLNRRNIILKHIPLLEMKNVTVRYNNKIILNNLTWKMNRGENWAILGPNGAGKSTLLNLILGENPQAYANDIKIFGKQKGTGESVWEIKKNIGYVSSALQVHYRNTMSAFDVVASGLFDSIGLYQKINDQQTEIVHSWIDRMGISQLTNKNFHHLSYGQKRMVLLARAMVKSPTLLILDEPCHGLDIPNREKVLHIIQTIGQSTQTNVLYVTHHKKEIVSSISHVMELKNGEIIGQETNHLNS